MHAAAGILTTRGGMTSHAAVVARGMGRPCVVGRRRPAHRLREARTLTARERDREGRATSSPSTASTGEVMLGAVPTIAAGALRRFRDADGLGRRRPRACGCAPMPRRRPTRARRAQFGAEGIGLCRTEHMFFEAERIVAVREMILADDEKGRRAALAKHPADAARTTSSSSSGSWRACR